MTKTLEEMKAEMRDSVLDFQYDVDSWVQNGYKGKSPVLDTDAFAEKVWNAALDACRENYQTFGKAYIDELPEPVLLAIEDMTKEDTYKAGWNDALADVPVLSAIDSLRTGSGKE